MASLSILILIVLAIFLAMFKYLKACVTVLLITLVCFLMIGDGLLPSILLKNLQLSFVNLPQPQWKASNAIVLLGAGTIRRPVSQEVRPTFMAYSRIYKTAALYFACKQDQKLCTIIISGGDAWHTGKSEAIVYRDALLKLGINNAAIEIEPNSMNTFQNAQFISLMLKQSKFDQIVLVTSGIHLKRALLYFAYFGIHAEPASADYLTPIYTLEPIGYNFALMDFAIHEYLGIIRLPIYNFIGWNSQVASQSTS